MSLMDLREARRELLGAKDRDAAVDVVLRFASNHFGYAAAFAVVSGEMQGHDAIGPSPRESHRTDVRRVCVRPPWGSIFWSVMDTGAHMLGAPRTEFDRLLLSDLGRQVPASAVVVPVRVRGRPVMLLYADNGRQDPADEGVVDLVTLCAALPAIFEGFIRSRKSSEESPARKEEAALRSTLAEAAGEVDLTPMAIDQLLPAPPDCLQEAEAVAASAASPEDPELREGSLGEASLDALSPDEPAYIVERLAMGGEAEPSLLVALAGHGAEAARALAHRFPGPTKGRPNSFADMERDPLAHGPVVAAMAFLGPAASGELLELCHSHDDETRLYAVFLLRECPDVRALPRLVEMLSDPDPRVATAARAAIAAHRGLPGYLTALGEVRGELGRLNDPLRLCDVLRALAYLADPAAVPRVIDLLDHGDKDVSAAAENALVRITKESFGLNQKKWRRWLEKNRHSPRIAWLVDGLTHRNEEIRESSLIELSEMTGETFGFEPDAPRQEREQAMIKWRGWLKERCARS